MVSCALRTCHSRNGVIKKETSGITFHRFPKDAELLEAWLKFTNRENWTPTKYSVLCSKHFLEKDFDRTSQILVRLKKESVPMLLRENLSIPGIISADKPNESVASVSSLIPADSAVENSGLSNQLSPREKALLRRLHQVQRISAQRKLKLLLLQRKLVRRERKISNMKNIIADLRNKKLMEEKNLLLSQQLEEPQEYFFMPD